ncbi:hypothetical protein [Nocardia higoensis]|uniref:hypothetical protein n=1 Tax=Nocardia higoensis TaxID=228599 RepID=UPI0002E3BF66|nr:hypothetical protein [Nocardia higoensis]
MDVIFTELRRCDIPASRIDPPPGACSRPGGGSGASAQPITVGIQAGADAIVLVIDRSMVAALFGESGAGRMNLRSLYRATKARSCGNQLCESMTGAAVAIAARRLLILCDAGRTSVAERTRAIRWVREAAHRIGYECSINGLRGLGTSYLILVADTESGAAARSVVDWCRSGEVR